ncbi:hypothetical protein SELMODRAFT_409102 [Selaginella moellendorffii]|uniref:F-box domain-containing protein n=1 Tax=Selaginella moellendorffii TaxID=88036 RepID=D8R9F5_SELML|nr:hypothetical protein SELMODRAFT_409102 [Selaginella moellendorffii]
MTCGGKPSGISASQRPRTLSKCETAIDPVLAREEGRMEAIDRGDGGGCKEEEWWGWLWIVFSKLDGRSLASCCCVSRAWQQAAGQEELWRGLCAAAWPGLALSDCGEKAVSVAGGYRRFYGIRMSAAAQLGGGGGRSSRSNPRLRLRELVFFLDVHYRDSPVCSMARGGDTLKRMFQAAAAPPELHDHLDNDDEDQGTFRFVVEIPTSTGASDVDAHQRSTDGNVDCAVWVGNSGSNRWSKKEIRDFTISWAVMVRGSPKVFQILRSRQPGQVVGNTCNYSERLPIHSCCCCLSETNHVAEVDLYFSADGGGLFLRELRCSILNTDCWRYFTQVQALQYLQHALLHDCQFS